MLSRRQREQVLLLGLLHLRGGRREVHRRARVAAPMVPGDMREGEAGGVDLGPTL